MPDPERFIKVLDPFFSVARHLLDELHITIEAVGGSVCQSLGYLLKGRRDRNFTDIDDRCAVIDRRPMPSDISHDDFADIAAHGTDETLRIVFGFSGIDLILNPSFQRLDTGERIIQLDLRKEKLGSGMTV